MLRDRNLRQLGDEESVRTARKLGGKTSTTELDRLISAARQTGRGVDGQPVTMTPEDTSGQLSFGRSAHLARPGRRVYSNAQDGHPIHMNELTEEQVIDQLADRLVPKYPAIEPGRVSRVVHEEYTRYEGSPIRDYIPLLVERHAKAELDKLVA